VLRYTEVMTMQHIRTDYLPMPVSIQRDHFDMKKTYRPHEEERYGDFCDVAVQGGGSKEENG
jgi:hypothetical protein